MLKKAAYDFVDRNCLCKIIMTELGIPRKLVNLRKTCSYYPKCQVLVIELLTFELVCGRGDRLSLMQFNLTSPVQLVKVIKTSLVNGGVVVMKDKILGYADSKLKIPSCSRICIEGKSFLRVDTFKYFGSTNPKTSMNGQ